MGETEGQRYVDENELLVDLILENTTAPSSNTVMIPLFNSLYITTLLT